jgi:long-chain fatty acid transport protein
MIPFQRTLRNLTVPLVLALFLPASAGATNGYFSHGYGTLYKGLAGAGSALHLSTLAPATNPASMVWVGHRYDVGVAVFNPNRQYSVSGNPSGLPGTFGLAPGTVESGSSFFAVPNFGANWMIGEQSSFGFALYGNGGMNTDYQARTFGFAPTGVDLSQLFIAPTYARKLGSRHAIGVSGIVAYQRFRAQGLSAFTAMSSDAGRLSDNEHANSPLVSSRSPPRKYSSTSWRRASWSSTPPSASPVASVKGAPSTWRSCALSPTAWTGQTLWSFPAGRASS